MHKISPGFTLHNTKYKSEIWESLGVIHDRTNTTRAESYLIIYYSSDWVKSRIFKFALDYVSNSFMSSSSFSFIDKISFLLVSSIEECFEKMFF